jgi:hypothetical protein
MAFSAFWEIKSTHARIFATSLFNFFSFPRDFNFIAAETAREYVAMAIKLGRTRVTFAVHISGQHLHLNKWEILHIAL